MIKTESWLISSLLLSLTIFAIKLFSFTVKLGFKERLDKEQLGDSEICPITNMPVHLINSEQIGFRERPKSSLLSSLTVYLLVWP